MPYANQTESDRHKSDLAAAEQEKQRLRASVAEHSQRFQEERLEKQQLTTQLELQHTELLSLKSEFSFADCSTQDTSIIYSVNKCVLMYPPYHNND